MGQYQQNIPVLSWEWSEKHSEHQRPRLGWQQREPQDQLCSDIFEDFHLRRCETQTSIKKDTTRTQPQ